MVMLLVSSGSEVLCAPKNMLRGNCSALQASLVQSRRWPPSTERVGLPQTPQKRCRSCHHSMPLA